MGDRYVPSRSRRDERPSYDGYDRSPRYSRDERYAQEDRYSAYDRDDRYDAYDRYSGYDGYRAPPPRSPPRGDRYSAQDAGYTFRGAAGGDSYAPPPESFIFRAPGPRFPSPDRYAPPPQHRAPPQGPRAGGYARRGDSGRAPRGRGRGRAPPPSSRRILHETGRERTPEQLEGMDADGQVRFNPLVTSSDESEAEGAVRPTSSSEEEGEIRRKRFKVDAAPAKPEVPKWSNPDPYSVLPPVEGVGAPKKDIVNVIRKAKNDLAPKHDMTQAAAQNADFISFTFDNDMNDDSASSGEDHDMDADRSSPAPSARSPARAFTSVNGNGVPLAAPIDLTNSDSDEDPPSRKLRKHGTTPIDLTGDDDDGPPGPPAGLIMPTDEELVAQYVGSSTNTQANGKKRKHAEQSGGIGDITAAWQPNWTNPTPWCTVDRSHVDDAGLRLHQEISDFFDFVRPHEHEETVRRDLIKRVEDVVCRWRPGTPKVEVRCFGSFAAGLYLPTADMDLVAVTMHYLNGGQASFCQSSSQILKIKDHIGKQTLAQKGTLNAVPFAKVPIVKFIDERTGIKVDISFENDSGLIANETFQQWKIDYPSMPVIVVMIKQLLAMRDLNEVFTGGLGGFSIICLVVSMLQLMDQSEWDDVNDSDQPYTILLLKFLNLYGNVFNLHETGIRLNPPAHYSKKQYRVARQNPNTLTIIDPNNPNNDISGGSRNIVAVFDVFRKSFFQLQHRLQEVSDGKNVQDSMLGCILGGNYSSFIKQRNRLYKIYSGERVSPPPKPALQMQPLPKKRKKGNPGQQGPSVKHQHDNKGHTLASSEAPLSARVEGAPPAQNRYHPLPPIPPPSRWASGRGSCDTSAKIPKKAKKTKAQKKAAALAKDAAMTEKERKKKAASKAAKKANRGAGKREKARNVELGNTTDKPRKVRRKRKMEERRLKAAAAT